MGNFQYWTKKLSYQKKCSCTSQNIIQLLNAKLEKLLYPKAALRKVLNKAFIVCTAFLYKETLHGEPKCKWILNLKIFKEIFNLKNIYYCKNKVL